MMGEGDAGSSWCGGETGRCWALDRHLWVVKVGCCAVLAWWGCVHISWGSKMQQHYCTLK